MKSPVKVFGDLPNQYAQTNVAFSPDEQLIFTGTSIQKDSTSGSLLCFFDRRKLELFSRVGISPSLSVIRCLWHPRINQVWLQMHSIRNHYWYSLLILFNFIQDYISFSKVLLNSTQELSINLTIYTDIRGQYTKAKQ